jgi:hypothetical protein
MFEDDWDYGCNCDSGIPTLAVDTTAAAQLLKQAYLPFVREQFDRETAILQWLRSGTQYEDTNVRANDQREPSGIADADP